MRSTLQIENKKVILPIMAVAIVLTVVIRLLPYMGGTTFMNYALFNFSPVAALALFGGAMFSNKRIAMAFSFGGLLLSDVLLELIKPGLGFYPEMLFVYISFLFIMLGGSFLAKNMKWYRIAIASVGGSLLFFLLSNFGVWLMSGIYAPTFSGLVQCFTLALAFYRDTNSFLVNTFAGDLLYNTVFFGGYAIVANMVRSRLTVKA